MKKVIKITILGMIIISGFISCNEEWLEPQPKSFYSPENVYVNKAGFESLIYTMRKDLIRPNVGWNNNLSQEFAASDLASLWSGLDWREQTPNSNRIYTLNRFFTNIYGYLKTANVVVSRIDDIEWESEDERNAILGEALWHRAYWYYWLVNSYGDVPFIGEEVTGPRLDFYTHSRWAILNKLQEDLEFAEQWLPESGGPGAVTKGAANHLLALVYLANCNFDKAIETATKVINGPYALMMQRFGKDKDDPVHDVIWDLHRPENFNLPENMETIMTFIHRFEAPSDAKIGTGSIILRNYNCAWFQAAVKDSQGKNGMVADGTLYWDSLGRGNANATIDGYYRYNIWSYGGQTWRNSQDLRRADKNWIDLHEIKYNNPKSVDYGKPVNLDYLINPKTDTVYNLYAMPFYITWVPDQEKQSVPSGGYADWYIYRLAGTYLIRAEAYYWNGQLAEAANDINQVRERANAIPVTPAEVDIDFIFDERARELFAEEQRHSELVRVSYIMAKLNKDGYSLDNFSEKNFFYDRVMRCNKVYEDQVTMLGRTSYMDPFNVLWAIPSNVITANTMGVINQNKGYVGDDKNVPPLETIE